MVTVSKLKSSYRAELHYYTRPDLATEMARESSSTMRRKATSPNVPEMMYTWVWRSTGPPCGSMG